MPVTNTTITPTLAATFVALIVLQLVALTLLPRTQGFTNPGITAVMLTFLGVSYWLLARMIRSGANLGILIPLMSTIIPLATIAIGVLLYGESASGIRIGLLVCACVLVGIASRF
jgi:multidrug transporter EmrE-like cation transporter